MCVFLVYTDIIFNLRVDNEFLYKKENIKDL